MSFFSQENKEHRIDGAAMISILSVALLFDVMSMAVWTAGLIPPLIAISGSSLIQFIPILGQIVGLTVTTASLGLSAAFWGANLLFFIMGGMYLYFLFKSHGVNIFKKRIYVFFITFFIELFLGLAPTFLITALIIIQLTKREDAQRWEDTQTAG